MRVGAERAVGTSRARAVCAVGVTALGLLLSTTACAGRGGDGMSSTPQARSVDVSASHAAAATPPLVDALRRQDRQSFDDLLRNGGSPNETGPDGASAMHFAARHEDRSWLEALLARGGDPSVRNSRTGARPIMDAVQTHRDANIDLLLAAGADPDATNNAGDTALHVAAATNKAAYSLRLLEAGADPLALDGMGNTFQAYQFMPPDERLDPAIRKDRDAIRAWLRARGIPVEG